MVKWAPDQKLTCSDCPGTKDLTRRLDADIECINAAIEGGSKSHVCFANDPYQKTLFVGKPIGVRSILVKIPLKKLIFLEKD